MLLSAERDKEKLTFSPEYIAAVQLGPDSCHLGFSSKYIRIKICILDQSVIPIPPPLKSRPFGAVICRYCSPHLQGMGMGKIHNLL